jgi:hypothetical protein
MLDAGLGDIPVCMLTKQLYVLKATLSTIPETKKHAPRMISAHAGSISELNRACRRDDHGCVGFPKSVSRACCPSPFSGIDSDAPMVTVITARPDRREYTQ